MGTGESQVNGILPLSPAVVTEDAVTVSCTPASDANAPGSGTAGNSTASCSKPTVNSGMVTKANRLKRGKNLRWTIPVILDGQGAVTVVVGTTTVCYVVGAISRQDGRRLSNRQEITVPGTTGYFKYRTFGRLHFPARQLGHP